MGLVRVPPPREARSLLYENQCPAMDSCGVMGMLWGHFGMCARVLRAVRSWPAHAAPRSSPIFARSRSSSMSGAAGCVSHGSVVRCVVVCPRGQGCLARGSADWRRLCWSRASGCLLLNVKGTFIGMSESRRGIINDAETATSVPCDPRENPKNHTTHSKHPHRETEIR